MQTLSITRTVAYGVPPRQFRVTCQVGDERRVLVEVDGKRQPLTWRGKGYRPGSAKVAARAIEKFLALEAAEEPRERANRELAGSRPPAATNGRHHHPSPDRQLPVGDRA